MMPDASPFAYIRRSVMSRSDPGDISREFQSETVRRLAAPDADRLTILAGDWGKSAATDKTNQRLDYLRLIEMIEAGHVSHVYAYSPDRLTRSVEWSARLVNACRRAEVPITTTAGVVPPDDPGARMLFNMLAVMNENALEGMVQKANATVERRKERNIAAGLAPTAGMGRKPYGSAPGDNMPALLAAFRAAGSFLGTARALNAANVPTRVAGKRWDPHTVSRILVRAGAAVNNGRPGSANRAPLIYSGLLRCPCGATLSGDGRRYGYGYICRAGRLDPAHPRPGTVAEAKITAWVRPALDAIRNIDIVGTVPDAAGIQRELHAIESKRLRFVESYAEGVIDKATRDAYLVTLAGQKGKVEASGRHTVDGRFVMLPAVDWSAQPADINAAIRHVWSAIILGRDLLPRRAVWVPTMDWTAEGPDLSA